MRFRSPYDHEIARLALPALGALAADPLVSLVDTAWVGRLGPAELGGLAVAGAVFGVAFFLFNFLAYGTTPFVAAEVAEGRRERAGRFVATALAVGLVLGVAGTLALWLFDDAFVSVMGAGEEVAPPALTYLRIRALAVPAVLLSTVGHGAFRGYQDTRTPFVVAVVVSVINLALDPLLIFGAGLGVAGAAWATVVAQWLGAFWFGWLLLKSRRIELGVVLTRPKWSDARHLLGAGRALVLRTAALLAAFTYATAVATRLGTIAVAAHQVAFQVWLFLALVLDALAVAGQAMVGRYLAVDVRLARDVTVRLLGLGLVAGVGLSVALWIGRPFLPSLFTDDAAVVAAVGAVYWLVIVMQPLNALVFVWDGIAIGAQAFGYLARWMVVAAAATVGGLAMVGPMGWGLEGVWWSLVLLMVIRGSALAVWQLRGPLRADRVPSSPGA